MKALLFPDFQRKRNCSVGNWIFPSSFLEKKNQEKKGASIQPSSQPLLFVFQQPHFLSLSLIHSSVCQFIPRVCVPFWRAGGSSIFMSSTQNIGRSGGKKETKRVTISHIEIFVCHFSTPKMLSFASMFFFTQPIFFNTIYVVYFLSSSTSCTTTS